MGGFLNVIACANEWGFQGVYPLGWPLIDKLLHNSIMKLPNSKLLWQLWSWPIRFEIKPSSYSIREKQETATYIQLYQTPNVISFISAPSDGCFLRVINTFVYVTTAHYYCLIQNIWCSLLKTPFYSGEAESLLQNTVLLSPLLLASFLLKWLINYC